MWKGTSENVSGWMSPPLRAKSCSASRIRARYTCIERLPSTLGNCWFGFKKSVSSTLPIPCASPNDTRSGSLSTSIATAPAPCVASPGSSRAYSAVSVATTSAARPRLRPARTQLNASSSTCVPETHANFRSPLFACVNSPSNTCSRQPATYVDTGFELSNALSVATSMRPMSAGDTFLRSSNRRDAFAAIVTISS